MFSHVDIVKEKLSEAISQLCEVSWMFAKDPKRNFTRNRKLPFESVSVSDEQKAQNVLTIFVDLLRKKDMLLYT